MPVQYGIRGRSASQIVGSVETLVREGRLAPGASLPTVRELASSLRVSPTTVAAAYRTLRVRGLVHARGRLGTRVSPRPAVAVPRMPLVPAAAGLRDVSLGNPDPALLPDLRKAFSSLPRKSRLYGEPGNVAELLSLAGKQLSSEGLPHDALAVVGGALDGIERVLQAHLRPGDRVAVEDPGYIAVLDLVASLGLVAEPVAVDDSGPVPEELARALAAGVEAFILTPRAQNPTGAALDAARVRELRRVLSRSGGVLVIEDDHAGPVAGADAMSVCGGRARWAIVRSVSKSLGPDLRLAVLAGDAVTVARVEGRQALGTGWVSRILQDVVVTLWSDASVDALLRRAAETYASRRAGFIAVLAERGIEAHGRSGLNVWVPVGEEAAVVAALARAGWAVRAGERYRVRSGAAVRVTVAGLDMGEGVELAGAVASVMRPAGQRLTGGS